MWYERRVSHNGRMVAVKHSLAARGIKTKRSPIGRTSHLHDNLGFKSLGHLKGRAGKTINAYDKSGHHIASASYYHMPGRMELAILGVDPEHQSEGIGSQMVDLVIKKQERLGSYLYVIAEPDRRKKGALVRFYESKGFKKLKPLEGNRWVMVRPPTGKMPTSVYNRPEYEFKEKQIPREDKIEYQKSILGMLEKTQHSNKPETIEMRKHLKNKYNELEKDLYPELYRGPVLDRLSIPTIKGEHLEEYLKRNNLDIRQGRNRSPGEKEILVDLGQFSYIMFVKKK
jgi:GNAT superfamily N-acetyltransferase